MPTGTMIEDLGIIAMLMLPPSLALLPLAGRMVRAGGGRPSPPVPPMHPGWILAAVLLGVAIAPR